MRERWADNVKGFAIYLVVLGHCIQYASHEGYSYADNFVFKIIYSFHMPLFMLISGYLFYYTFRKYTLKNGIMAKIKGILIPCMMWGLVTWLLDVCLNGWRPISVYGYLYYTYYSNWFLWAVFYCSLIGFMIEPVSKYIGFLAYILLLILNYFIPAIGNSGGAKRLLPFFVLGMILNKYKIYSKIEGKKMVVVMISVVVYISSMCIVPDIELITGTVGSILICVVFIMLSENRQLKWMNKLGQMSIGIYLFSGIVFYFWIKEYFRISESYRYLFRVGYVFGMSIVLTAISYGVCLCLKKNRILNGLFLGKGFKHDKKEK